MTRDEETAERNACDEWWHAQPNKGASIQDAWVERARRAKADAAALLAALKVVHQKMRYADDMGPYGEGWQSDELSAAWGVIDAAIGK